MRKNRKTIGVDMDTASHIKEIASKRNMSIASYVKKLVEEALKLESLGYYAPRALAEKRIEILLEKMGFSLIPLEIANNESSDELAESKGVEIGKALAELGVDPYEVVEYISTSNQVSITRGDNIILLPQTHVIKQKIVSFIKGIAKGSGLQVSTTGNLVVIEPPRSRRTF
ncbi:MAG: CopG family transcriptional regulator [Desulfurococcaceae archaeon]